MQQGTNQKADPGVVHIVGPLQRRSKGSASGRMSSVASINSPATENVDESSSRNVALAYGDLDEESNSVEQNNWLMESRLAQATPGGSNSTTPDSHKISSPGHGRSSLSDTKFARASIREERDSISRTSVRRSLKEDGPNDDSQIESDEDSDLPGAHAVVGRQQSVSRSIEEEYISTPMVQAELVAPPVEAYQVAIDEDPSLMGAARPEMANMEIERGHHAEAKRGLNWRPHAFLMGICLCLTIAAIVVPLIVVDRQKSELDVGAPTSAPSSSPSLSPTFPYKCYTSTEDILESQRNDEDIPEVYIICPDTDITIGSFRDPNGEDFSFVGGDYPFMAIRENVVIQCGLDGSIENNCTVRDGFIQVLTGQEVPTNDGGFTISDPIDNFTLRGIRFTGIPVNSGPFVGNSVTLSHPGSNIRFEDCMWIDFSTSGSLISISRNEFLEILDLPVEDGSISVTFTNCRFESIIYDGPLIYVNGQNLSLEDSLFQTISLSVLSHDLSAGFLLCQGAATCYAHDLCLDDIEYSTASFISVTQDVTDYAFERLYWENITIPESECELGIMPSQERGTSLSPHNCSSVFISDACPAYLSF